MKVQMNSKGEIWIYAETGVESYALEMWSKENGEIINGDKVRVGVNFGVDEPFPFIENNN
jgi:hypothetical protein